MRIALLSDIHGNLQAFEACLKHAQAAGAERYALLGDFVGYGAQPSDVVDRVMAMQRDGAVVLKGNHDDAIANPSRYMNELATEAIDWTREQLSAPQREYLAALPLIAREAEICFVHASAVAPERWDYVDSPAAARASATASGCAYTFCGHVHHQALYFQIRNAAMSAFHPTAGSAVPVRGHRRWLAVVGSVGQPRDRKPAAAYAIFDAAVPAITFHRVPYDHSTAARKIRESALPDVLAYRVERGV